jgi:CBS domain-containing protein
MHQRKYLMSRDVKVISPDMTNNEAARTMRDGDFGSGHCDPRRG